MKCTQNNGGKSVSAFRNRRAVRPAVALSMPAVAGLVGAGQALAASGTWNGAADSTWATANVAGAGTFGNWGTLTPAPGALSGIASADVATFSSFLTTPATTPASPFTI